MAKYCNLIINNKPKLLVDCTPEDIQSIIRKGRATEYFKVGDVTQPILLNGKTGSISYTNRSVRAFIIGINHNVDIESGGKPNIHFAFARDNNNNDKDIVLGSVAMNPSSEVNSGGWRSCYLRTTVCAQFFNLLPTAWKEVISDCTKYTDNVGTKRNSGYTGISRPNDVTATSDKIFILSHFEIFKSSSASFRVNQAEKDKNQRYEYYNLYPSKQIKYLGSNATDYWLRSCDTTQANTFMTVNSSGYAGDTAVTYYKGFVPAFMIA